MKNKKLNKYFSQLIKIMSILRSKKGCPWDRKQTQKSILPYLIEETYELVEAINRNDTDEIKEELGDLLLQVVFHSQIAKEKGRFDIKIETKNEPTAPPSISIPYKNDASTFLINRL